MEGCTSLNNQKGFTTIELILAIAIAGIIMGAVGTFLTFNLRSFNTTTDVINIQYEGQLAMNQLTDIAKQSTGIIEIKTDKTSPSSQINEVNDTTPYYLVFKHEDDSSGTEEITTYELFYDESTQEITVTITYPPVGTNPSDTETYIMAGTVESFVIATNGATTSYRNTDSIQINMRFEDGDAHIDLQSHVKFRNKR